MKFECRLSSLLLLIADVDHVTSFTFPQKSKLGRNMTVMNSNPNQYRRRGFLQKSSTMSLILPLVIQNNAANAVDSPDSMDVDDFLKSGMVMNPMGVSGQAGKSKPDTGVLLRDGSEVARDAKSGSVSAEIVVNSSTGNSKESVFVSFESPWPLAKGAVFDIECRDNNGDISAFVAVTSDIPQGSSLKDLPNDFFLERLFSPTGRYSFYGPPTDIKVKRSIVTSLDNNSEYRIIDLTFSNLSQSTQTEIPRVAKLVATVPNGTSNAVMLVSASSASKYRKNNNDVKIQQCVDSFRAALAPKSSMKIRTKKNSSDL